MNAGHYVLGIEGLALLRTYMIGDRREADRRVEELRQLVTHPEAPPLTIELDAEEATVREGYARWATTYDAAPNPLIRLETPIVHAMIDALPPGRALDAACGTGRHARHLHARGHRVVGVDATEGMLARARAALPEVEFRTGELTALPLESGSVDLGVCALALTHCERLEAPMRELGRVLRPGGHLLVSDLHPTALALGMTAFFVAADGSAGYIRSYPHTHAGYLAAFRAAGLEVAGCVEPTLEEQDLFPMSGGMMDLAGEAFRSALLGLPNALVWNVVRR